MVRLLTNFYWAPDGAWDDNERQNKLAACLKLRDQSVNSSVPGIGIANLILVKAKHTAKYYPA